MVVSSIRAGLQEGIGGRFLAGGDVQPTVEGFRHSLQLNHHDLYLNVWLASTAMGLYSKVISEFTPDSRMRKSPPYLMVWSLVQSGK